MEQLKQWLGAQHGRGTALAQHLKVSPPVVAGWIAGKRPVPVSHAAAIESFTAGAVTRQDLFPNDWPRIWPELTAEHPVTEQPAA
jgi:DNA-binding transcriptional regulator YdaS (Cro superfamily)